MTVLSPDLAAAIEADSRTLHETGPGAAWIACSEREGWTDRMQAPEDRFRLSRELARSSATLAWIVACMAEGAALAVRFARTKPGRFTVARNGNGRVGRENGVVRLHGTWEATPAAAYADTFLLACSDASGTPGFALAPADRLERQSLDFLGGLRGAGYARLTAAGTTLPDDAWLPYSHFTDSEAGAPLLPVGPALGLAEAAYRDYVAATRKRVSGIGGQAVAQFTQVQIRIAAVGAELDAAALLFERLLTRLGTGEVDTIAARRDAAFIVRRCQECVTQLVRQMGALGLVESNPVQRHHRDMRTLAADPRVRWEESLIDFGRREFGLPSVEAVDEITRTG